MADPSYPVRFVVPGPIAQRTGGYGYDRRIVEELRRAGRSVRAVELDGAFPISDAAAAASAASALAGAPDGSILVIDGLALPAFATSLADHSGRIAIVVLVHHRLALETGLAPVERERLAAVERALLARADGVVTTSLATARSLADYAISEDRISVVAPGTDPAPPARGGDGETVQLLCVGALIPRKGHLALVDALADCADLPWRLTCYGSPIRDPKTAAAVEQRIAVHCLGDRIALAGEVGQTTLAAAYDGADVFVLASALEGYGMAFAEALARGLPIVGSGGGAVRDTVPAAAGLLAPVGDGAALAASLAQIIEDAALRDRLAEGARDAGLKLPDWRAAGRAFMRALDRFALV